ncbi:MAG: UDP-N-acetylglucosamine 2-epimerase [Phycisphaerae bacterium]
MSAARAVAVVTGTRADFGVLRSTLRALRDDRRVELKIIAAGMHLLPRFGRTLREVERDFGTVAARVPMQRGDDDPLDQAQGLARGVAGMARYLRQASVRWVVVLGDRIEAMAGALAAVTTGCRLAHIHGGDVARGDFDDQLRDAITQLADVHFVASRAAARRVRAMGAPANRVFLVGAPGLDAFRADPVRVPARPVAGARGSDRPKWTLSASDRHFRTASASNRPAVEASRAPGVASHDALIVYHAFGRSAAHEERVMRDILRAAATLGLRRTVIFPNSDRGNAGVIRAIREHGRNSPRGEVRVHRSLPHDEYVAALRRARVLVGNSSSGIIEAPFVGTPSVNVGDRQFGREPGGPSVIHAREAGSAIRRAIQRALRLPRRRHVQVYGDGGAGARIVRILMAMV